MNKLFAAAVVAVALVVAGIGLVLMMGGEEEGEIIEPVTPHPSHFLERCRRSRLEP